MEVKIVTNSGITTLTLRDKTKVVLTAHVSQHICLNHDLKLSQVQEAYEALDPAIKQKKIEMHAELDMYVPSASTAEALTRAISQLLEIEIAIQGAVPRETK